MEFMLVFQFLGIIFFIIFIRWIWQYLMLQNSFSTLPGPKGLPFLGSTLEILKLLPEDRFNWFVKTMRQFNGGITVVWFSTTPNVFIRKPWQLETIVRSTTSITKGDGYKTLSPWLGNGLITSTGKLWQSHRRLITPAFYFEIIENYAIVMCEKVEIFNEIIQTETNKNPLIPINIYELVTKYTLDSICETAMGLNMDIQRKENSEYVKAVNTYARIASERVMQPWFKSDAIFNITRNGKEQMKVLTTMLSFVENVIQQKQMERKKRIVNDEEVKESDQFGKRKRKAFLDLLLDENEKGDTSFTLSEIRDEVNTFMFAGHDTTASSISWSLYALGNAPEIQAKLQDEFKEVFGNDKSAATTNQLGQLKYLDRVIKEVLRMYTTVPQISRQLSHDTMIDDYLIPKGTQISLSIYQLHHDPEIWENPENFDPDRFLPENSKGRHPYAFIPFSAGPRNCIGQKFALLEIKTTLTAILRNWHIKSIRKPSELKMVVNLILKPHDNNIPLLFTRIN